MSERMSRARLDEIKARADAATEGPWTDTREDESGGDITYAVVRGGLTIAFVPEDTREEHDNSDAWKDAAFIANAREDVPAMLAEIERAWGEIERLTISEKEGWANSLERAKMAEERARDHSAACERWNATVLDLRDRLAHAHDSANGLLRAASDVLAITGVDRGAPSRALVLKLDTLRAAIDPALSTAALAETQRRDGLDEQVKQYEERETQVSNILATALIEVDHDPAIKVVDMAQQAASVIVGTLSRPTLTAKQAREKIEAIVYVPGRSPFAMVGPLVSLLMRGDAPDTAEQAPHVIANGKADRPGSGLFGRLTGEELQAAHAAHYAKLPTPPPEMATTTGEDPWDADEEKRAPTVSADDYEPNYCNDCGGQFFGHHGPCDGLAEDGPVSQ